MNQPVAVEPAPVGDDSAGGAAGAERFPSGVPFAEWGGPRAPSPVLEDFVFVDAILTGLTDTDLSGLSAREHAVALSEWTRIASRVGALRMRILASAEARGVTEQSGDPDLGTWAAGATNSDVVAASREAKLAGDLDRPARSSTHRALAEGLISPEHASVIVTALSRLPGTSSPEQVRAVESDLLEKGRRMSPRRLRAAP